MLPYLLILPLWYLVAIGLPAFLSLHALQKTTEDAVDAKKTWIYYWVIYAIASCLLYYFEWLIRLPFFVLSFYIDIYYEVQLALALYLVLPQFGGITKIRKEIETNAHQFGPMLRKAAAELVEKSRAMVETLGDKYLK